MPLRDFQKPIAQVRERLIFPHGPADADESVGQAERQLIVVDQFERGLQERHRQERVQDAGGGDNCLNRLLGPEPDAVAGEALDMLNARQRGVQQLRLDGFDIGHGRWSSTGRPGRFSTAAKARFWVTGPTPSRCRPVPVAILTMRVDIKIGGAPIGYGAATDRHIRITEQTYSAKVCWAVRYANLFADGSLVPNAALAITAPLCQLRDEVVG